ncbi:MAG TPA: DUF6470 family protein [Bacilli bacterium]
MTDLSRIQIQIRTQPARLGIDADMGQLDMTQPKAAFEMETTPATLDIRQPQGEMEIDYRKAWDALGAGDHLETMQKIYSQMPNIALRGIARIVEDGNRMAAIHLRRNVIADLASEVRVTFPEIQYVGEASYDNVDVYYTARKAEIHVIEGGVDLRTHPNRPEINYHRGKLDIYVMQHAKIEITPPRIDRQL